MATLRASGVRRLSALFQRSKEAVFVLDSEHRLVYVNTAWEALTGHGAEAVFGLPCRPHGPSRGGDLEGLGGSFCPPPEAAAGRPSGGPTLVVHAGGERRWKRVEFWPLHEEDGRLLGFFGVVRDPDAPPHAPDSASQRLRAELLEIRERMLARYRTDALIGQGPSHRRLLAQITTATASMMPVLIVGEPGTGKRLVARTIHLQGPRASSPLIPFDCAALPAELLERELFETAPDGAPIRLKPPDGASLVLGDVLDLARDLQEKLARVLEDSRVRLLALSTTDPEYALRDERLRADLYYAMTGLVIHLPPLRERREDLPLLAQHLLDRANLRGDRRRFGFRNDAMDELLAYDWPGNIRELGRVVDAAHERSQGDLITPADLPAAIRGNLASAYNPPPMPPPVTPLDQTLEQLERKLIEHALQRARQNKSKAAELLDISRPRLYRRIKELGIPDVPEPGEEPSASHAGG